MRDILQRALEREAQRTEAQRKTGFSRGELVEAAREAGLDPAAIDAALAEAEQRQGSAAPSITPADRRRRKRNGFYRHAISYIVVNCMLALMTGRFLVPVLAGWGIGILIHLVNVFILPKDAAEKKGGARGARKRTRRRNARGARARPKTREAAAPPWCRRPRRPLAQPSPPRGADPSDDIDDEISEVDGPRRRAPRGRKRERPEGANDVRIPAALAGVSRRSEPSTLGQGSSSAL